MEKKKKKDFYISQLFKTHIYEQTILNQLNLVKATTEVSLFFFKLSVLLITVNVNTIAF